MLERDSRRLRHVGELNSRSRDEKHTRKNQRARSRVRASGLNRASSWLPELSAADDALRFVADVQLIGSDVRKKLLHARRPCDLDVGPGRAHRARSAAGSRSASSSSIRWSPRPSACGLLLSPSRECRSPDRFDVVPTHLIRIELFPVPPSFRSSVGGPSRLLMSTSTSPSLSKSPKAHPRPRFSAVTAGPASAETSRNRPFPRLR